MIQTTAFDYKPAENEAEKASNSYLISLVASVAGLPLPIVNLLATLFFFVANKRGTYFVRWHCTQALMAQFSLLFMNSAGFWWTVAIVFGNQFLSNAYVAYMITIILFNFLEFLATVYTSIQTRKGRHVTWWFYGELTDILCKR
jgi:hypothetical protein